MRPYRANLPSVKNGQEAGHFLREEQCNENKHYLRLLEDPRAPQMAERKALNPAFDLGLLFQGLKVNSPKFSFLKINTDQSMPVWSGDRTNRF